MSCSRRYLAAALAAGALALAGCGGEKAAPKKAEPGAAVKVTVARAAQETVPDEYVATGTVKARVTSTLSARVMGYIREIRVQASDAVRAGQVVAVLDAKEIETSLRQAEAARSEARSMLPEVDNSIAAAKAQLDLANATYKRMQSLFQQKSITDQEFDEVAAKQRMAQASVEMAQARRVQLEQRIRQADESVAQAAVMKGYTEVTAPFAGTVIERRAEPGMLASPGTPLLVVEQAGNYRLEAAVEESRLGQIKPGMAVSVDLETREEPIKARVSEIVPAMDAASRTFTVKIDLPGGAAMRSGMFGRARFPMSEKQALTVPASSIAQLGQVQKVYVVEDSAARGRMVTTGARHEDRIEVLSGLEAGQEVVAPLPGGLADGARIEVRR